MSSDNDVKIPEDLKEKHKQCVDDPEYLDFSNYEVRVYIERIARLRSVLIAAGRNTGALLDDQVSDDFLQHIPDEIKAKIELLTADFTRADTARTNAERDQEKMALLMTEQTEKIERLEGHREHTVDWYAQHYGKLHDWARKVLPEPYRTQFFSCIANGLYDAITDVGKPYKTVAGFMVTPGGYFQMEDATKQILFDQCVRAEDAEAKCERLERELADARKLISDTVDTLTVWSHQPFRTEEGHEPLWNPTLRRLRNFIAARIPSEGKETTK